MDIVWSPSQFNYVDLDLLYSPVSADLLPNETHSIVSLSPYSSVGNTTGKLKKPFKYQGLSGGNCSKELQRYKDRFYICYKKQTDKSIVSDQT